MNFFFFFIDWFIDFFIWRCRCGDGDHLSLYLHLDRSEVNERTPSNGRVCSMPAKRSGRYGSTPLRYYSAKSTLVLAFHTGQGTGGQQPSGITTTVTPNQQQKQQGTSSAKITSPSDHHDGDVGPTFWSSTTTNSSGPYGFRGTYRFIRKSRNTNAVLHSIYMSTLKLLIYILHKCQLFVS